ncbi:YcxB family protein [Rhizobium lusitanum]|uniref:YcxB family protein n=1 Tax=Rhizobium lusitanum TaxID=293958 RepID=UPI00195BB5D8|nr:YcxB family protein [Rhizobium lusitanum]MBM7048881.1 YcxB family protein [Rhizobium lusitanum]
MSELKHDDEKQTNIFFQLEPQDLMHALRLHFRQHLRSRPGFIRLAITWVLAVVAYGILVAGLVDPNDAFVSILSFAILAPVAITGIPFLIVYTFGGRTARRTFREQKTLQKPLHFSWTESGVHLWSDFGEARLQWSDFLKARQDRHCILLYESQRLYRIIPKRVLTNDQIRELQALALKVRDHQGF